MTVIKVGKAWHCFAQGHHIGIITKRTAGWKAVLTIEVAFPKCRTKSEAERYVGELERANRKLAKQMTTFDPERIEPAPTGMHPSKLTRRNA